MTALFKRLIDYSELKRLLVLMIPLYMANLLNMGMGVVDTVVAGQAGPEQLAGVALGTSVTVPIMVAVGAVLTIIGPMVSRLLGAGCEGKVGLLLNNAKLVALFLMLVEVVALLVGREVFALVSDDAQMVQVAQDYLYFLLYAVPVSVLIRVLQGHFEGYGHTRPAMLIACVGLLLNIPLNYIFVFGWGPVPAMGGAGCGLTTTLVHYLMAAALLLLMAVYPRYRRNLVHMWASRAAEWRVVRDIISKGTPLGVASLCEMSFFCVVTLVIAPLGVMAVGAHQIAINVSALLFMFPLFGALEAACPCALFLGLVAEGEQSVDIVPGIFPSVLMEDPRPAGKAQRCEAVVLGDHKISRYDPVGKCIVDTVGAFIEDEGRSTVPLDIMGRVTKQDAFCSGKPGQSNRDIYHRTSVSIYKYTHHTTSCGYDITPLYK